MSVKGNPNYPSIWPLWGLLHGTFGHIYAYLSVFTITYRILSVKDATVLNCTIILYIAKKQEKENHRQLNTGLSHHLEFLFYIYWKSSQTLERDFDHLLLLAT